MNYRIRPATSDDAVFLSKMFIAHALHEGHILIFENQFNALNNLQRSPLKIYVVEQDQKNEIVGYMSLIKQYSTWDMDWYLYLDCLYLHESIRGGGVGKKMMDYALTIANTLGIRWLQWQTPENNELAIAFYHHLGASSKAKVRFYWNV
jgi:ribosomal protein S18 acetylase RimI-like enzyme